MGNVSETISAAGNESETYKDLLLGVDQQQIYLNLLGCPRRLGSMGEFTYL